MSELSSLAEPWFVPDTLVGRVHEEQLLREVGRGHELHGRALRTVAKCGGCDSVLFGADDGSFALVHLTWAKTSELPPWPRTTLLDDALAAELAIGQHVH